MKTFFKGGWVWLKGRPSALDFVVKAWKQELGVGGRWDERGERSKKGGGKQEGSEARETARWWWRARGQSQNCGAP